MPPKKGRSGFNADYLSGLSENTDQSNVLGSEITKKHEDLQQELQAAAADPSRLQQIKITLLDPNPWQGRHSMDEEELEGLTQEIKENGFNEAMPVVARPHPTMSGRLQIVFGHRRTIASQRAGLAKVPTLVKEYTDEDMLFLQAKENLLREQFTPIDEAFMFGNMLQLGYTQMQVAQRVKKSRGYIRNRLELVASPEDVQAMVRQDPETVRAAYYLKKIEDGEVRGKLIQAVLKKEMTGESIPGYLLTLKERENQERQAQATLSLMDEPMKNSGSSQADGQNLVSSQSNEEGMASELQTASTLEASQATSLLSASIQERPGQGDVQPHEPQPSHSIEQVIADGEKRGKELIEAGKLRTIFNQLQGYQRRCEKRQTPPSFEELSLLKSIEEFARALQKTSNHIQAEVLSGAVLQEES